FGTRRQRQMCIRDRHLIAWETDLPRGLARAQGEGKPVVIDTWATWCANCRVLEKKTFGNPDVAAKVAERFVPIKVQLESADSEATRAFMARFGMSHYSLPTTLLLDSQGTVRRVLRGVVGPDEMIAALAGVR
ncbi:MAG: thioredoxin family protein, partial [candidate division Zixibacteria bacterium]|nr:thioredoxin family protein [candidate division Zixibacteria bacterium]